MHCSRPDLVLLAFLALSACASEATPNHGSRTQNNLELPCNLHLEREDKSRISCLAMPIPGCKHEQGEVRYFEIWVPILLPRPLDEVLVKTFFSKTIAHLVIEKDGRFSEIQVTRMTLRRKEGAYFLVVSQNNDFIKDTNDIGASALALAGVEIFDHPRFAKFGAPFVSSEGVKCVSYTGSVSAAEISDTGAVFNFTGASQCFPGQTQAIRAQGVVRDVGVAASGPLTAAAYETELARQGITTKFCQLNTDLFGCSTIYDTSGNAVINYDYQGASLSSLEFLWNTDVAASYDLQVECFSKIM